MSTPPGLLQAGLEALKQQRYSEAVRSLEAFCRHHAGSGSRDYFQAQMWLVKAYQQNGQWSQAVALCQQLAISDDPQIQTWARQVLPSLRRETTSQSQPTQPSPEQQLGQNQAQTAQPPPGQQQRQTQSSPRELFQAGHQAAQEKRYPEAIQALEAFCRSCTDFSSPDYFQAQMWLVKAYQGNGQLQDAIALCQQLTRSVNPQIQEWANLALPSLTKAQAKQTAEPPQTAAQPANQTTQSPAGQGASLFAKAGRAAQWGVRLPMAGIAANLSLASTVTLGLLFGMVLVLFLALFLILENENPALGLTLAVFITLIVNLVFFFLAPVLMDVSQQWLYQTRWVPLSEVQRYSPEAARVIQQVCSEKKLKQPRLGIINDQNPTAFTYGSLRNNARLVVSQGLFTYLDDDEVATVYAHELGHIVHWDFAVMTVASTLIQITYLVYIFSRNLANSTNNSRARQGLRSATITAYIFYIIGSYLVLYLSRTREYFADHFAAETTGNPNGLSRSLVKIAYGIVEEGQKAEEPSRLIEGTRALGIYDPKAAASTGTAYSVAVKPKQIGQVMLWDMFNPWGWWMELNSTHPLTGKRIRALTTYAEKLGLDVEFDMATVISEGRRLNKKKLYGTFALDILVYGAEYIGVAIGLLVGVVMAVALGSAAAAAPLTAALFCFGVATLIKAFIMYPNFHRAPQSDVLKLMTNPYASPLRGQPVNLAGELIGRGDAGYRFGSDLKFRDRTGMIFLRYASRFGPLGNFLFGAVQVEGLIGTQSHALGWFRRGIAPWVDLVRIKNQAGKQINSYHRFWKLVIGIGALILSFVMPALLAAGGL